MVEFNNLETTTENFEESGTGNEVQIEFLDTVEVNHTYLEHVSDFANAEAITESFSALLNGGVGEAMRAYGSEVKESFSERDMARRLEAYYEEPAFSQSQWDAMQAKFEALESKLNDIQAESEATKAELADTKATLEVTQTELQNTKDALAEANQTKAAPDLVAQPEKLEHYQVQPGDTLWKISQNELGDGSRWREIYNLNAETIGADPSRISVGQNLILPTGEAAGGFHNFIPAGGGAFVPVQPVEPPPPQVTPGEGTQPTHELIGRISPEQIEALEQKITALTGDPHGITERNITNDPALDNQRIQLKNALEDLDRAYLREEINPDSYDAFTQRYDALHNQYNHVSAELYRNHVDAVPLQYADHGTLERLQYNNTTIARAMERGDIGEVDRAIDNAWRDYDDAKNPESAGHRMAGGRIPNPEEGKTISST